jgi:tRNA U34 5-methylaminomethyl-2-thiouridine-forming methyltransferase MnmC
MGTKREFIKTADGSHTLYVPELDETYHSINGAIAEAYHVFIKNGFNFIDKKNIRILEIGFGTGLNCLITYNYSRQSSKEVEYTGVEAYPVEDEIVSKLNYLDSFDPTDSPDSHDSHDSTDLSEVFKKMHSSEWEIFTDISEYFKLKKQKIHFKDIECLSCYDLIYFDAFGPMVQPELWTVDIFKKMYQSLDQGGVLVTYSAKGSVRRAMQEVGFTVERLEGPPGKREMLRANKIGD